MWKLKKNSLKIDYHHRPSTNKHNTIMADVRYIFIGYEWEFENFTKTHTHTQDLHANTGSGGKELWKKMMVDIIIIIYGRWIMGHNFQHNGHDRWISKQNKAKKLDSWIVRKSIFVCTFFSIVVVIIIMITLFKVLIDVGKKLHSHFFHQNCHYNSSWSLKNSTYTHNTSDYHLDQPVWIFFFLLFRHNNQIELPISSTCMDGWIG